MSGSSTDPAEQERLGMEAYRQDRLDDAAEHLRAAQRAYLERGDRGKAAEMANNLCVSLLRDGRPQEALEAVLGTAQVFVDLGDEAKAAQAFGNLASALGSCGDAAGAEEAYHEAANRFTSLGDKESLAHTMKALSRLQLREGRVFEAITSMQTGLEGQSKPGIRGRILRRLLNFPFRFLKG